MHVVENGESEDFDGREEGRKGEGLGNEFELMAVISLLSILEVERRNGQVGISCGDYFYTLIPGLVG